MMSSVDESAREVRMGEQQPEPPDGKVVVRLAKNFDEALKYAAEIHREQTRKGTTIPYIAHLLQVAGIVLEFGGNQNEAIAALLHDAAEDQGGWKTVEEIRHKFGDTVANIVEGCSDTFESPKPPWRMRKEAYIRKIAKEPPDTRLVSAADKLHNARAILIDLRQQGEALFKKFNGGKAGTFWYYRALIDAFRETGTCPPLIDELNRVVSEAERLAYPERG